MILKNTPKSSGKSHKNYLTLVLRKGKCGSNFFKKLRRIIHSTKCCLGRLKRFLHKHFILSKSNWKKIKRSILKGKLKTKEGRESFMNYIKNQIHHDQISKRHWTRKHHASAKKKVKQHGKIVSSKLPPKREDSDDE